MFDDCIIMAGGSGTRLWPASTSQKPKQFLEAPGGGTFLSASITRALAVTNPKGGRVIIIAGAGHTNLIAETCARFSAAERKRVVLIPEPEAKNTAPAIACGLVYVSLESGCAARNILVLTSDHLIGPLAVFKANAKEAASRAAGGSLLVFGITPLRPDTGYGYIEAGEALLPAPGGRGRIKEKPPRNTKRYASALFKAVSFREKPPAKKALEFVSRGNFFWNSGMFAFSSTFMLEEFNKSAPGVIDAFKKLKAPDKTRYETKKSIRVLSKWRGLDKAYAAARAVSFDYAIAEKCKEAVMLKADFDWIDIGSWDEYARLNTAAFSGKKADKGAAGKSGQKIDIFSKDSSSVFVDSDIPVALAGVEDLIVVIRSGKDGGPEAALIVKKGETGKVKNLVEQIKASGRKELL